MKRIFCLPAILCPILLIAQVPQPPSVHGKVFDTEGHVLSGAGLHLLKSGTRSGTGRDGTFSLKLTRVPDTLEISYTGYLTRQMPLALADLSRDLSIQLTAATASLEEVVVNTGYQALNRERATGSFVQIDNALLNRRVSTNVLERLDGVAAGLLFNKSNPADELLTIRGRGTLLGADAATPLIVVDNFPFEGDINSINPNDVASITILKDAAAASIWGARSANGVIVITTKKGKYLQPLKIDGNMNITVTEKPNLFYSRNFLGSSDYIDIENLLFDKGYYNAALSNTTSYTAVSPVIEILNKKRSGLLSADEAASTINALRLKDVRNEYTRYFYQPQINRQYAIRLSGGSDKLAQTLSMGLDDNRDYMVTNGQQRVTVQNQARFTPFPKLELESAIQFTRGTISDNNQFIYGGAKTLYSGVSYLYPYATLNERIVKDYRSVYLDSLENLGFLNGYMVPTDELNLGNSTRKSQHLLLRMGIHYQVSRSFKAEFLYQYEKQDLSNRLFRSDDSYYVRNLINKFTQRSTTGILSYPFPMGGILDTYRSQMEASNLRGQLNYHSYWKHAQELTALAGAEIRQVITTGVQNTSYGYDDELGTTVSNLNYNTAYPVHPSGNTTLPQNPDNVSISTRRFLSYYINAAYTLQKKYTLTVSGRKDGANLYGIRANQRITPLWSAGAGWEMSKETFYKSGLLPFLKIRATYGYNGNTYNGNAFLIAKYSSLSMTGLPSASISAPANPDLQWEKVRNINLGIDFAFRNRSVSGTIEWFQKDGIDLVEDAPLPPSSGYTSVVGNAASTRTKGVEISLQTKNLRGKLEWNTFFLFNTLSDRVTHYDKNYSSLVLGSGMGGLIAVEGRSLFGIYSFPYAGLDPLNGDPQGYLNGNLSKDYNNIIQKTTPDSLVYHGSARPGIFGSIRNNFTWKGLTLSFNITYKFQYYFRRNSISLNYTDQIGQYPNQDYLQRWQQTGDEVNTYTPSLTYPSNTNRSNFYKFSEVLIEKGDHIRLQDIQLSYDWIPANTRLKWISKITAYTYLNNLGILWRANHYGIDPDFNDNNSLSNLVSPRSIALGLKISF